MTTQDRKYPTLGANFLKGTLKGQIDSIHRTRETQPDKVADFQKAIACRDIHAGKPEVSTSDRRAIYRRTVRLPLAGRSLAVWA